MPFQRDILRSAYGPVFLGLSKEEWKELILTLTKLGFSALISYYITSWLFDKMNDQIVGQNNKQRKAMENILKKSGKLKKNQKLTAHEAKLATQLLLKIEGQEVCGDFSDVGFQCLGGLGKEIALIKECIMEPIQSKGLLKRIDGDKELSANLKHYSPTSGLLLYGPPGTGKTALVKALSVEINIPFLHIEISSIMDKYLGESNKYVSAIFSLARKLAPVIVFIDEVDALLGIRMDAHHEMSNQVKSQFLSEWDGLDSGNHEIILVGATNRPYSIDPAVLRRFTTKVQIPMPVEAQLEEIFKIKLRDHDTSAINQTMWTQIAKLSVHYKFTGADVKEVCKFLARTKIKEFVANNSLEELSEIKSVVNVLSGEDVRDGVIEVGKQKL